MQHTVIPGPAVLQGVCNEDSGFWAVSMVSFPWILLDTHITKAWNTWAWALLGNFQLALSVEGPQISSKCI